MKSQKSILAIAAALLFGASGLLAQTSTGSTSTGSTSGTGTTSTGSTSMGSTGSTSGSTTGSTSGSMTGSTTGSTSMGGGMGKHGSANPHTVNPNSSAVAQAVQTILQKFDANRDQFMAERKALLDKLAAATTEADRQAILAQLKADMQTEKDQRAQLGKEIRDELKTLRQQRKGGG